MIMILITIITQPQTQLGESGIRTVANETPNSLAEEWDDRGSDTKGV